MAIELEFISLIIPITNIDRIYPGGFKQYQIDRAGYYICDDSLVKEGAMSPWDMEDLVEKWETMGLQPFREINGERQWGDLCVVDYLSGLTLNCDWIEHEKDYVWLKGREPGEVMSRMNMTKQTRDRSNV